VIQLFRSRPLMLATLSSALLLQGCTSVKRTLGIERDAPDEFAVLPSYKPLDMPPDFHVLPEPTPGMPQPQGTPPAEKILGVKPTSVQKTPGQQAILELAKTHEIKKEDIQDIRQTIDEESRIEAGNKDLLEKLGVKKRPKGTVIDPTKETKELKDKGISRRSIGQ